MFRCQITNFFYTVWPQKVWRDYLIRRHIERCPSCQAKLASRGEAESLLMNENRISPQPSLWPRVKPGLVRIEGGLERKTQFSGRRRWRWAAVAAGFLIVGLSSFWVLRDYKPDKIVPDREAETFRINYLKVENKPAQAYLYQPLESNLIIVWVQKST
jgi:hypothetical protein